MTREQLADFLTELTALSKKYGIYIAGCGCVSVVPTRPIHAHFVYTTQDFNPEVGAENLMFRDSREDDFEYMEPEDLERVVQGRL